ncbi:MAG: DUF4906 domain-containing protein [Rikenellaceae bacterium]
MKNIVIALLCMVVAVGCSNDSFDSFDSFEDVTLENLGSDYTPLVRFNLHSADNISVETKGYDANLSDSEEKAIDNYNIFCYNEKSGREIHQYVTSNKSVDLKLDQGEWEVYVIANTNSDLSSKTIESLKTYSVSYITAGNLLNNNSRLHMSYYDTITVTEDATIDLKLERAYAKVNVNVTLSGAASSYKITSRKVNKAPIVGYLFKENLLTLLGMSFETDENFSFYMFENMQGINADITSAKNKIAANAPTYATYIEVTAQSSTHEMVYRYYLGENTINDFNIRRNHTYNINMNISGNSSSDLRVETTVLPTVDPEPEPTLTYAITGDTSRKPYVDDSWYDALDSDYTFTLQFESGNDSSIPIEFYADLNNVNSDETMEYMAFLFTETTYNKFVSGAYDIELMWSSTTNMMRESSGGALTILSPYDQSSPISLKRHTYATVSPNTTYKLVLQRYAQPYGDPAKSHDIRLYMNKGTTNQKYVDLTFSTVYK